MNISKNLELGSHMTFELCKQLPIHSWFYYKEGYSPEIVRWALGQEKNAESIMDPFCGVGTSMLAAKQAGLQSRGIEASELAVFVSKTKTQNYETQDLEEAREFIARVFSERREESSVRWEFELFDVRVAFPKRNLNELLFLRERIENQNTRPKARNLLLLALLSILPQCSLVIKDGGVLKMDKRKRAMPVKDAFRRKVKRMINELEQNPISGPEPEVYIGDARRTGFGDESEGLIVTSPPYLNNIDYSKIYGLELSLFAMSKAAAEETRMRSIRSFIRTRDAGHSTLTALPPEVGGVGERIPIVGTYFTDMEESIKEMKRLLVPGGAAYIVVSNSVIHETHVLVDEIFAEMGERIGFSDVGIVVGAERIADVRPARVKTRESVVVLRK
jgi:DNA modification methylase